MHKRLVNHKLRPQIAKLSKLSIMLLVAQGLSGCASSITSDLFTPTVMKDYSNMYLRGVFNWWEASDNFKLQASAEKQYSVTIELIADGQPYDFKVSDNAWSMTLNCGNAFGGNMISLGDATHLVCASDSVNLQFMPAETGNYQFTLDVSDNEQPILTVNKTGR